MKSNMEREVICQAMKSYGYKDNGRRSDGLDKLPLCQGCTVCISPPFWAKDSGCWHPYTTPLPLPASRALSASVRRKDYLAKPVCCKTQNTSVRKASGTALHQGIIRNVFLSRSEFLCANLPWPGSRLFVWTVFLLGPKTSSLIQGHLVLYCPTFSPPHCQQAARLCLILLKTASFPDQGLPAPISPIKYEVCIWKCGIIFIILI